MKFTYGEIIENVYVEDMTIEGLCVGRSEGRVLFIKNTAPGDIVDVRVFGKGKNFLEAEPIHFHSLSSERQEPFCAHFGTCGGCKWQQISYNAQLHYKEKAVKDTLNRIAKLTNIEVLPIIASEKQRYYRNKLEFTFSNKRWFERKEEISSESPVRPALGFHVAGKFDKVLDIEHCYLQGNMSNEIRNAIKEYAITRNIPFFDIKAQSGLLRSLMIRTGYSDQLMVLVQFFENKPAIIDSLMQFVQIQFPQITSLLYVINPKRNDTFSDLPVITYYGKAYIEERIGSLKFRVGPKSFFQTHTSQAALLYDLAISVAELQGHEIVYDLYSGTGTLSLFAALHAKKVIGMEYVPAAVLDAQQNAMDNSIRNATFYAGDIAKIFTKELLNKEGIPDVIITDPPRAGMSPDVIEMLLQVKAPKIIYISCNPATQARDLSLLHPTYRVIKVQPVDMFPQTTHVESIALLHKA